MLHSQSLPNFGEKGLERPHGGSMDGEVRKSFDENHPSKGLAHYGDTRHAEMFVRDQLTMGVASLTSPLADILQLGGSQAKPQSKYDPNTGKFYRSTTVDSSCVPASLPVKDIMSLFCSDEQRYDPSTHTGVVVNISSVITVTCVGDTHVQADGMHNEVQKRIADLMIKSYSAPQDAASQGVATAMGLTLFSDGGRGFAEKDCELVQDTCAGISLFGPVSASQVQIKAVKADTCCGMTMFSVEDDELSETETEANVSPVGSMDILKQMFVDTCLGMSFFSSSKKQMGLEELVADSVLGQTLYSNSNVEGPRDVHAETCGGVTTFSACEASVECEVEKEENTDDIASMSVGGFTDFSPALKKFQQNPETYTAEQKWLSELAWAAAY